MAKMGRFAAVLFLLIVVALGACSPPAFEPTASSEPTLLTLATKTPAPTSTVSPSPLPTETAVPSPTAMPTDIHLTGIRALATGHSW